MNKSDNPLDNLFRDQLKDHEIQPEPHVWESINTAINKNTRKIWLILAPVILLLAALAIYIIANINPSPQSQGPVSGIEQSAPAISMQEDGQTSSLSSGGKQDINQESTQDREIAEDQTSSAQVNDGQENREIKSQNEAVSKRDEAKMVSSSDNSGTSIQALNENEDVNFNNEKSNSSVATKISSGDTKNALEREDTFIEDDISQEKSTSSSSEIATSGNNESASIISNSSMGSFEKLATENEGFQRFSVDHFKENEKDQRNVLSTTDLCALMYPKTNECPTFKDLNRRFQLDVYAIGGKKFSTLSTNNSVGNVNDYLNKRRSTETPLWNVGMGIRLANQWTNGISVRGGIQISKGSIRLNYMDESQRRTVVNVSVDTIIDDAGNTTVVWDTISVVETNIIPVEDFNNFTQLDVPLTVGYTFLGRNYDIELNGGVMFNLLFTKHGRIFDPENEIASIDPSDNGSIQAYEKQLGLSIISSVAFNYHLTEQISVFAEPQFRYFLKPVSPELYSLEESWFHMNLMLGTRYSF